METENAKQGADAAERTPNFGEPWILAKSITWPHGRPDIKNIALCVHGGEGQPGYDGNIITVIAPDPHITAQDRIHGERIVTCVNACVGMIDPAKEITELREQISVIEAKNEELHQSFTTENQKLRDAVLVAYEALNIACAEITSTQAENAVDEAIFKIRPLLP